MLTEIKQTFKKPTPLEMATKELVQAEHSRLEAQTATEYASSLVSYNNTRIARLSRYINELTKATS